MENIKEISGSITAPAGFYAASHAAGIKYQGREDMALIYSEVPCKAAGVFTTNVVKAAPVLWDRKVVEESDYARGVIINSGIANACTGEEGMKICRATAKTLADKAGDSAENILVASTGVIGMQIDLEKIVCGTEALFEKKETGAAAATAAARAIMTTDTEKKEIALELPLGGKNVHIGGMCKGSGMIHPNMCTMLGFLTTDLSIEKALLQEALSEVVKDTFNMVTVDGDTSTNDTLLILANGLAGNEIIAEKNADYELFVRALYYICEFMAKKMAADGEGATKLFEAKVVNAKSKEDARTLSRAIVASNLSKAAIYGCDANFGRFLCAMGYSGAEFDQGNVELFFESKEGRLQVFDHGTPLAFDEELAVKILGAPEVTVYVDMHEGEASATAWGCDLTYDYVKINADYRS